MSDTIENAASNVQAAKSAAKASARKDEVTAAVEEAGARLGENFRKLEDASAAAASRIELATSSVNHAIEELKPVFEIQRELGAAVMGSGVGTIVGASASFVIAESRLCRFASPAAPSTRIATYE
jgi:nucleoside recognition membrane protein YjiH